MPKTLKFKKLLENVEEHYEGKQVPVKFQPKYGKVYSKEEARSIGYAIAKKRGYRT